MFLQTLWQHVIQFNRESHHGRRCWTYGIRLIYLTCASALIGSTHLLAQPTAPRYDECRLDSIFPNGGQRGTSVKVEFKGHGHGLTAPRQIVIDGPGGITVRDIKQLNINLAEATLDIASDAPLGRRLLRVANERSGITNFAAFVVSDMPELVEVEPNNETVKAQSLTLPIISNGHITPAADLDVYRFSAKTGQKLIAAIAAHALDVHGQYKDYGIADFSLELADSNGKTLASAEDTIGFDPVIEMTIPADGDYFLRVQLLNYAGFAEAVYRLTVGDVPYVTSVFPAGFQRGTSPVFELTGPGITQKDRLVFLNGLTTDPAYPLLYGTLSSQATPDENRSQSSGLDVPLLIGDLPESTEAEPNDDRNLTRAQTWPITLNGRFQQENDVDWYRISMTSGQKVVFESIAHRFIRSPIDTLIQVYDSQGKLLGENDDEVFEPGYESYHDFKTTDSKLIFIAPATGDFFVRISEQSGVHGPRAIYRLSITEALPDFRLTHFPDAVPVWGPGTTSCVLVRTDRFLGFDEDIEISVEGLPAGWTSASAVSLGGKGIRPYNTYQLKTFVSITAPADAQVGTHFPFRIVGRTTPKAGSPQDAKPISIQRGSLPLSLFYTSDTGFFRASPVSRVAVAKPQGPWLEATQTEITIPAGGASSLPVKVFGLPTGNESPSIKEMPVVVNIATAGVACVLTTPANIPIVRQGDSATGTIDVPIKVPPETYPGDYFIVVAQTWGGDIRVGMPGPSTRLIKLTVTPKQ